MLRAALVLCVAAVALAAAAQAQYWAFDGLGCDAEQPWPAAEFNAMQYHGSSWRDDLEFLEWITWTFTDTSQLLSGIVNIFVVRTLDLSLTSFVLVNPMVVLPDGYGGATVAHGFDKYSFSNFSWTNSNQQPAISVGPDCGFTSVASASGALESLHVFGSSASANLTWDITISAPTAPWCVANASSKAVGLSSLESFSWAFAAPSARSSGVLVANGTTEYRLDGAGESDHVWGSFLPGVTLAHWTSAKLQFDDGRFLYWADMNQANGFLRVQSPSSYEQDDIVFDRSQFTYSQQLDPHGRPLNTTITAVSPQHKFSCFYVPMVPDLRWPPPAVEDIVVMQGILDGQAVQGRGWAEKIGGLSLQEWAKL